jgi:regulator of protease activity HflC (stomatin/prohibitin superfamily)
LRVEVQHLDLPQRLIESMELERAAEIRKRASIAEAEGLAESMELIIQTLQTQGKTSPNMSEILKFLIAQKYVQSSENISKSPNTKVIFMDPKAMSETISGLIESDAPPSEPLIDSYPPADDSNSDNSPASDNSNGSENRGGDF